MTDHLDEAAAKAVELAESLNDERGDTLSVHVAAHLAYLAGLIRGGAGRATGRATVQGRPFEVKPWIRGRDLPVDPDKLNRIEDAAKVDPLANRTSPAIDPRTAAANFRASAVKVGEGFGPHSNTWQAGLRHGYLMAADALDEVADEVEEARAQREELLAAAKQLLTDQSGDAWPRVELRKVVARIEAE
jgi:hypothetical protein